MHSISAVRYAVRLAAMGMALQSAATAHAAGDAQQGRQLAQQWCAGCHATAQGGADVAPPLQALARGRNGQFLFGWLTEPHPPMPQLSLSRREIADLIAYLNGLRAE